MPCSFTVTRHTLRLDSDKYYEQNGFGSGGDALQRRINSSLTFFRQTGRKRQVLRRDVCLLCQCWENNKVKYREEIDANAGSLNGEILSTAGCVSAVNNPPEV